MATEPPEALAAERGVQAIYFVARPNRQQLVELGRLAETGWLKPTVEAVYPLGEAPSAFERLQRRHNTGKIVLQVAGPTGA